MCSLLYYHLLQSSTFGISVTVVMLCRNIIAMQNRVKADRAMSVQILMPQPVFHSISNHILMGFCYYIIYHYARTHSCSDSNSDLAKDILSLIS